MIARSVERVRDLFPRGDFGRGVVTLVAGTGMAQAVVILTAPILTRIYPPDAYGTFAVALSVIAILTSISCLRLEFAIPLPETDAAAAEVLALALLANLAMSAIAALILILLGGEILVWLGASALGPFAILIPLGQLASGANQAMLNWAVRTKSFSTIARNRLLSAVVTVGPQAALGLAGLGAPGLLIGDVIGRSTGALGLARAAWRTHATEFRRVTRSGVRAAARRYRRFSILSTPSALLNTVGLQTPVLFFVAFYGVQAGGEYALASRVGSIPLALIAGSIAQVFFAEAARIGPDKPGEVRALFGRTTRLLARLGILPTIALIVLAPLLAGIIFGATWAETGLFIAILAPSYFIEFVTTATGGTLYVYERQDLQLLREILRLVLVGGSVPLAAALGLTSIGAVALLSAAACVNYVLYGLISWRAIVRHGSPPPILVAAGPEELTSDDPSLRQS